MIEYFRETDPLEMRQLGEASAKLCIKMEKASSDEKEPKLFRRSEFEAMAQAGLTYLSNKNESGGLPLYQTTAGIIFELAKSRLGRSIYLSVHLMVAKLLNHHSQNKYHQTLEKKLLNGENLAAFCLTESGAGSDAAALSCLATKTDSGYELNGEKIYITSGPEADLFLVFARTGPEGTKGISAFLVERDNPGLSTGKAESKMGCEGSPISNISLDKCRVSNEALLGEINQGFKIALSALAGGRVNIAAAAAGLSSKAIDLAVKHCSQRKQFQQPLIDFQGLKFILADMATRTEASILLTRHAAQELESGKRAAAAAAMAKCLATDSAMQTTTDAVQLLGGAGYLTDYGVEKLMRDAKMLQIVEGTNQIQRLLIANALINDQISK